MDERRGRNLKKVGTKKVLVIRVVAQDSSTTATEAELADDIFGHEDPVNLKSQYNACSYGQLQFNALTTNTAVGTDGVYTVYLNDTVIDGADDADIRKAVVNEATAKLGRLSNVADYVMIILPPGTGSWLAYAYVNYWQSVYNDNWGQLPSVQMHEIGKLWFVLSCSTLESTDTKFAYRTQLRFSSFGRGRLLRRSVRDDGKSCTSTLFRLSLDLINNQCCRDTRTAPMIPLKCALMDQRVGNSVGTKTIMSTFRRTTTPGAVISSALPRRTTPT